jgi:hypothetical protein
MDQSVLTWPNSIFLLVTAFALKKPSSYTSSSYSSYSSSSYSSSASSSSAAAAAVACDASSITHLKPTIPNRGSAWREGKRERACVRAREKGGRGGGDRWQRGWKKEINNFKILD